MLRRQPPLLESSSSKTSANLTGKKPQTLQSRLWPTMPLTSPAIVRKQRDRAEALEKDMTAACRNVEALQVLLNALILFVALAIFRNRSHVRETSGFQFSSFPLDAKALGQQFAALVRKVFPQGIPELPNPGLGQGRGEQTPAVSRQDARAQLLRCLRHSARAHQHHPGPGQLPLQVLDTAGESEISANSCICKRKPRF